MKNLTSMLVFAIALFTTTQCSNCKNDKCEMQYCLNGGDCLDGDCKCPDGYTGEHCETKTQTTTTTPGYVCESGNCKYVSDNGTYATLSDCQAACAPQPTGQVVFWENSSTGCTGATNITIGGSSKQITNFTASTPSCGASGCATFSLSPGTHNYTASCSGKTLSGTVTVSNNQCTKTQLKWMEVVNTNPADIKEIRLNHIAGDKEFDGWGPKVQLWCDLSIRNNQKEVWAKIHVNMRESGGYTTEGDGVFETRLWTCPTGKKISVIGSETSFYYSYIDDDTSNDVSTFSLSKVVSYLEFKGDTGGGDLSQSNIEEEGHLHILKFNPISVTLVPE